MEKIGDIRAKALELANLIDKMKQNDIGEEILIKWENENTKLLNKLEQDEKTALDVSDMPLENRDLPPKARENSLFERKESKPKLQNSKSKQGLNKPSPSPRGVGK